MVEFIKPNWNALKNIKAFTTVRQNGKSAAPFDSLNLSTQVCDDFKSVQSNRNLVQQEAHLPHDLYFLKQIHSNVAYDLSAIFEELAQNNDTITGDALYTHKPLQICTTLTADCLPVLFCNQAGTEIASAHAGWQGLQKGILESTIALFQSSREEIMAWFGPAISAQVFEVGKDVYDLFVDQDDKAQLGFKEIAKDRYLADIYALARLRLNQQGITQISGGEHCTYLENDRFFSYRKAMQQKGELQGKTGRMLTAIWMSK